MTAPARLLRERDVDFSYGFRMRCECGSAVDVTAETYYREQSNEALVPCPACSGQVHFGPVTVMLRNQADPILDDPMVPQVAWYHTSTRANWPAPLDRDELSLQLAPVVARTGSDLRALVERKASSALHLGTYEAAIENMWRRMRNQGDRHSEFYLYRVALKPTTRVEGGYRHENNDNAAQILVPELEAAGVDAIRYVNVHENPGSISLAIAPTAIQATQCIRVPLTLPVVQAAEVEELKNRLRQLFSELTEPAATPRLRKPWLAGPDDDTMDAIRQCWADLDALLTARHLASVSPLLAESVLQACSSNRDRHHEHVDQHAATIAAHAHLLIHATDVTANLATQPWSGP